MICIRCHGAAVAFRLSYLQNRGCGLVGKVPYGIKAILYNYDVTSLQHTVFRIRVRRVGYDMRITFTLFALLLNIKKFACQP